MMPSLKKNTFQRTSRARTVSDFKPYTMDFFIKKRDYTGALAVLHNEILEDREKKLWEGYLATHLGDYERAQGAYVDILSIEKDNITKMKSDDYQIEEEKDYRETEEDDVANLYLACVYYHLRMYEEAEESAMMYRPDNNPLKQRILYHCSECLRDAKSSANDKNEDIDGIHTTAVNTKGFDSSHLGKIGNGKEDRLSHAASLYRRRHYREATDIYKTLLLEDTDLNEEETNDETNDESNMDMCAINVYVSSCYFEMDYYDVSMEVLSNYTDWHPHGVASANLKACNAYRLQDGKTAMTELKKGLLGDFGDGSNSDLNDKNSNIEDFQRIVAKNEILRHNVVVFSDGYEAERYLPSLLDVVVPEARLNLAISRMRDSDFDGAADVLRLKELSLSNKSLPSSIDVTKSQFKSTAIDNSGTNIPPEVPSSTRELMIGATIDATIGQRDGDLDQTKKALSCFQAIGTSTDEVDTIPGRWVM